MSADAAADAAEGATQDACWRSPCCTRLWLLLLWSFLHFHVLRPIFTRLNIARTQLEASLTPRDYKPRPGEVTDLEVIVASPGTSGTHSMYMALEWMGFSTYRLSEIGFYLPKIIGRDVTPEYLVGPLRATGVRAMVVEPWLYLVPKLLAISPRAKVILTMRDYESWRRSRQSRDARYKFRILGLWVDPFEVLRTRLCHHLPVSLIWPRPKHRHHSFLRYTVTSIMKRECTLFYVGYGTDYSAWPNDDNFLPENPENRTGMLRNESNYEWYRQYIRGLVPPDRLLEFTPDMGWEAVAGFLGRPVPPGWRGEAWPRTRPGKSHDDWTNLQEDPLGWCAAWALNFLCLPLSLFLFCACARCAPRVMACAGLDCCRGSEAKRKEA